MGWRPKSPRLIGPYQVFSKEPGSTLKESSAEAVHQYVIIFRSALGRRRWDSVISVHAA